MAVRLHQSWGERTQSTFSHRLAGPGATVRIVLADEVFEWLVQLPDWQGDLARRLAAHSAGHLGAAAIEAGCVGYLAKPFMTAELLDTVRAALPAAS